MLEKPNSRGNHPNAVSFLTWAAYGVLPSVSKLSAGQARYHFLSGYTAKVAGTERGIMEPQVTFSTCFGGAIMTLHPTECADLLKKKLQEHNTHVYQINTGWTGGVYSVGKRMKLSFTSKCVDAVTSKMPFSMDRIDTSTVPPPRSKISTLQALPPVPALVSRP
ncbi:hypothetical protein V7S43_018032 [Phytophthora oleae]|uniref:Phosphoenolpyruvate carboxykinase (ATP) n=1 Tax=Phytophthora oleae TaxID=2107226 RepID=A0ABD3ERL9_9STRA